MSAHANLVNSQFDNATSHFVTLQTRFAEAVKRAPQLRDLLERTVEEFIRRNVGKFTDFKSLELCKAIPVPMNKILIDTTMQRDLNLRHIIDILNHFRTTMVMAIQVYQDENKPGYYVAWDGQHTAIALYIILTKVFGERTAQAIVPVVVYNVKHKLEIRRNFILLNGEAKAELDFIDVYRQMVHGAKTDNASDQEWQDAALKNDYLAKAGLFATHAKFGDSDQPGAITLLADTLMTKTAKNRKHPEVTRMFASYWSHLGHQRPTAAKEIRVLYEFFDLCYKQGLAIDDKYMVKFTSVVDNLFGADFDPAGPFWAKVKLSYDKWYRKANAGSTDVDSNGNLIIRGFQTEPRCGLPFLIKQLTKENIPVPQFNAQNGYYATSGDLW